MAFGSEHAGCRQHVARNAADVATPSTRFPERTMPAGAESADAPGMHRSPRGARLVIALSLLTLGSASCGTGTDATPDAGADPREDARPGVFDAYTPPDLPPFRSVTAGNGYFCATSETDELWCWDASPPRRVATAVAEADCAAGGCCAAMLDGRLECWRSEGGVADTFASETDREVITLADVVRVRVGGSHACALLESGEVACWGRNLSGQAGHGAMTAAAVEPAVVPSVTATSIAVGLATSYAIRPDGTVAAWGNNISGELGRPRGDPTESLVPVTVLGLPGTATQLDGSYGSALTEGSSFACAVVADGTVTCWGSNYFGELGGGGESDTGPLRVGALSNVAQVRAAQRWAIARLQSGEVYQWGTFEGETADPPTRVDGIDGALDIAAGGGTACAVVGGGTVVCWGAAPARHGPST